MCEKAICLSLCFLFRTLRGRLVRTMSYLWRNVSYMCCTSACFSLNTIVCRVSTEPVQAPGPCNPTLQRLTPLTRLNSSFIPVPLYPTCILRGTVYLLLTKHAVANCSSPYHYCWRLQRRCWPHVGSSASRFRRGACKVVGSVAWHRTDRQTVQAMDGCAGTGYAMARVRQFNSTC